MHVTVDIRLVVDATVVQGCDVVGTTWPGAWMTGCCTTVVTGVEGTAVDTGSWAAVDGGG